jgi:hypothetical protein
MAVSADPFVEVSRDDCYKPKFLVYGESNAGKTVFGLRFPGPVAVIDLEKGVENYAKHFSFRKLPSAESPRKILEVVKWLARGDHDYRTLVIDPITLLYDDVIGMFTEAFMRHRTGKANKGDFYDLQMGDWRIIKNWMKGFIRWLHRLDMNVVCVAREKDKYSGSGHESRKVGVTYDGDRNWRYEFDYVLNMFIHPEDGYCIKTVKERDLEPVLPKTFRNDNIEKKCPPSFILDAFGDIMAAKPRVAADFATEEQINSLKMLCDMAQLAPDKIKQALRKYGASKFEELNKKDAQAIIDKLDEKLTPWGGSDEGDTPAEEAASVEATDQGEPEGASDGAGDDENF